MLGEQGQGEKYSKVRKGEDNLDAQDEEDEHNTDPAMMKHGQPGRNTWKVHYEHAGGMRLGGVASENQKTKLADEDMDESKGW